MKKIIYFGIILFACLFTVNVDAQINDSTEIFLIVETLPRFPGGEEALMNFLAEKVSYPEKARKKGIEGTVFVSFIVESNGSITNAKVLRGIHPDCDAEALRVVNSMPKWEPGKQKGKNVRVQFNLPIRYMLTNDEEE